MVCTMSFNHLKFQAIYHLQYLFMAVIPALLLVSIILILHLEGWSLEIFVGSDPWKPLAEP